jgi:hypothetical protein
MDRRFIKKSILISSIYNFYLEIKSEDAESISKIFTERYNIMKIIRNGNNINYVLKKYGVFVTGMIHRSAYLCMNMHRYA